MRLLFVALLMLSGCGAKLGAYAPKDLTMPQAVVRAAELLMIAYVVGSIFRGGRGGK